MLALFLKDNFTFHPLSSEIFLKVPACYYEQKSSVNAEMLYPLLLPPCHRWILKHSIIKKRKHMLGMQHPLPAASPARGAAPLVLHSECRGVAVSSLLPFVLKAIKFLLSPPPSSLGGQGRCRSEDQGKSSSHTCKFPKKRLEMAQNQSSLKLLRHMLPLHSRDGSPCTDRASSLPVLPKGQEEPLLSLPILPPPGTSAAAAPALPRRICWFMFVLPS